MSYARAHRHFKYCKMAVLAQGVGVRAAFTALTRHPTSFLPHLRAICGCQPEKDLPAEAVTQMMECKLPALVVCREGRTAEVAEVFIAPEPEEEVRHART